MKRILISYPAMMLGGSTTSLLSILNRINTSIYQVDLLLDKTEGPWMQYIPKKINVLPQAYTTLKGKKLLCKKMTSPKYLYHFFISKYIGKKQKCAMHGVQYFESRGVDFYRTVDEAYDVAIAFLEGRQCKYVANQVNAKRKIAWIHIDYGSSSFDPKYDLESMEKFDKIVLVSEKCKESFDNLFPELLDKTCVIENILSAEHLKMLSLEKKGCYVDSGVLNLVTTCRIAFKSKGLDRAIEAMEKLKSEELLNHIHWYIIGDGPDRIALEQMIAKAELGEYVTLLGMQTNPYCYLKNMSLFFLPSRWEGKPMAVTEAFMLGLPVFVTEYSSAREQIRDGFDGMIVSNNTEGIYNGLLYIIKHPEVINEWKRNVDRTNYSNEEEMKKIISVIEGRRL